MEATAAANLGNVAQEQGHCTQAEAFYNESLAVYRQMQYQQGLVIQLYNLASLHVQTDSYSRAIPLLLECLTLCRELNDTPTLLHVLEIFGHIAMALDETARAIELYAAAATRRRHVGVPMSPRGREHMNEVLDAARRRLGADKYDRAWRAGDDASTDEIVSRADWLRARAGVA